MKKAFAFSFVMAVYNVELYLREAINSIVRQDFGFDRIQLILVDDGTPDGSGTICDEYAVRYPDNVLVIHKENGGVSSARNAGLRIAEGEYVCFMDSDDKLTEDVCSKVYGFLEAHGEETDVVSIPMFFFGGEQGAHVLNKKFEEGSRIIDLCEEYSAIQLSSSSAFIRRATIAESGLWFDETQKYAEDATLIQPILWKKMTLGVVSGCKYLYRTRTDGPASAIQSSTNRREWWIDYLRQFPRRTIKRALEELGEVPLFCQYVLAYDLQWRVRQPNLPKEILTEQEIDAYWDELVWIYGHIADRIILEQEHTALEYKIHILKKKHGCELEPKKLDRDLVYAFSKDTWVPVTDMGVRLDFLTLSDQKACIEGFFPRLGFEDDEAAFGICVNGTFYPVETFERRKPLYSLDEEVLSFAGFKADIPLAPGGKKEYRIAFALQYRGACFAYHGVQPLSFFPVGVVYESAYYARGRWIACFEGNELVIHTKGWMEHGLREIRFLKEVWKRNLLGGRKAVPARLLRPILKAMKRKELWMVSDRVLKADDNGEAFFTYLCQRKDKDICPYFVIGKDCADYDRIHKIGKVVDHFSFRHKMMHLICDYIISAAGDDDVINPFAGHHEAYRDILWNFKFIFLQHGIIKDDLSEWLNRYNKNIYGFVTSAMPEYQSIVNGDYHYPPERIWLTGLPRYDRLYHKEENLIALMPTWRRYLMDGYDPKEGKWVLSDRFAESKYRQFYNGLMNHPRLLAAMKEKGYHMLFMPHPNLMPHLNLFEFNEQVEVGTLDTRYRDVYARSKLVISDYSSAVFDFSYLRKPIIYAQFDTQEFFSGGHMYKKGYFEYERDGFGEVTYDLEETVNKIIEYMENDCKLKEKYRKRIDQFFAFDDQENCRRLYKKIRSLQ